MCECACVRYVKGLNGSNPIQSSNNEIDYTLMWEPRGGGDWLSRESGMSSQEHDVCARSQRISVFRDSRRRESRPKSSATHLCHLLCYHPASNIVLHSQALPWLPAVCTALPHGQGKGPILLPVHAGHASRPLLSLVLCLRALPVRHPHGSLPAPFKSLADVTPEYSI